MEDRIDKALEFILSQLHEEHKIAIGRHIQEPNLHQYNLMSIINKILDSNPSMIDDLFINEKCRNISSEVIAKTIKGYLFFGDQTKDDLRNRFLEIKEWYNNHGIQWPDDRLLGWTFTNEDEPNKEMEESID